NPGFAIRHPRIALSGSKRRDRDVDVDGIRRKGVAHSNLARSIEQLIGQSEKPARSSEEVILPPKQVVSLARHDVDEVTFELHECVPHSECCVVEIRSLCGVARAGRLPGRSAAAIDIWLIAKQVKLEHPARAYAAECRCLRFESEPAVSDGELQARVVVGLC